MPQCSETGLKTSILMAGIVALFGAMGAAIGGQQGMLIALVMGGAMNVWAYWFSDKMVLKMYKAREVDAASSPYLYNMVAELARRAELPMPKVYIIDEAQPNAFATGRNPDNAAVAATTGIVRMLSERELRGVMAHELDARQEPRQYLTFDHLGDGGGCDLDAGQLRHVLRRPRRVRTRPNPIVSIAMMILAPLAGMLIQMAISRTREFGADRGGAGDFRRPRGTRQRARQDRRLCARDSDAHGRASPRDRADDDHEPACGRRPARPVFHPPLNPGAHRPLAGDALIPRRAAHRRGG